MQTRPINILLYKQFSTSKNFNKFEEVLKAIVYNFKILLIIIKNTRGSLLKPDVWTPSPISLFISDLGLEHCRTPHTLQIIHKEGNVINVVPYFDLKLCVSQFKQKEFQLKSIDYFCIKMKLVFIISIKTL